MNDIPGKSFPLGATACPGGVNFSVFAKGGEAVQLLLFDHPDDAQPSGTITFDPVTRTSTGARNVSLSKASIS
jgi:pullulanase/glycogen debranching enzyme